MCIPFCNRCNYTSWYDDNFIWCNVCDLNYCYHCCAHDATECPYCSSSFKEQRIAAKEEFVKLQKVWAHLDTLRTPEERRTYLNSLCDS